MLDMLSQVWYDDAESLTLKYELAHELGLRGVRPWKQIMTMIVFD